MDFSPPASLSSSRDLTANTPSFFQPPNSPPLIASPSFATSNDYFAKGSRKRSRPDSAHSRDTNRLSNTWAETPSWAQFPTPRDEPYGSTYGQDSALVNERYRLADGFDTPSLEFTLRQEQPSLDEHDYRRRIRDEDMGNTLRSNNAPLAGPLARERNGVARMAPTANSGSPSTWTSLAFGLVGKVFNFGTQVFKGFYAGGGKGFDLQQDYALAGSYNFEGKATPLPGSWQEDEFLGDFEQDSPSVTRVSISRPPNKRRQTDRDSWVMVGTPDADFGPSSPKRKPSSTTFARTSLPNRPTASRASSRKSIAPLPRRTTSYVATNGSPGQQSMAPPPFVTTSDRRASFAPTRSPHGRPSNTGATGYMSPEVERHAKRQARQDKTMTSLGRRMEEMIRQAQEALGTKYSVEGDLEMEDEGYVDDDW